MALLLTRINLPLLILSFFKMDLKTAWNLSKTLKSWCFVLFLFFFYFSSAKL